jgi:hypothetical protein
VAELKQSLTPSLDGRQAGPQILGSLHGDVFFYFELQDFFVLCSSSPGDQSFEEPP